MFKQFLFFSSLLFLFGCKLEKKQPLPLETSLNTTSIEYASGFKIDHMASGIMVIKVLSPWPDADATYTYALIPKNMQSTITLNKNEYDAIIPIPIKNVVVTSTTHIPALEELGVLEKLIGFPGTQYISSKAARKRIDSKQIKELGANEKLNTEVVLALQPNLVVGFAINSGNTMYQTLQRSQIPVVYNGDWAEQTPLGKAEWIKFFAPFFDKVDEANTIFKQIEKSYLDAKKLASTATTRPTVLSGALYKDVWYLPGGNSWGARFLKDANADYLWNNTSESGSLSLSWESVLEVAKNAEYWIGPAQFSSYKELNSSSPHYSQFDAFQKRKIFSTANTTGETGGTLYYELAPQRPDLVLKDLIHILHPGLLPNYNPFFFKPLL